MQILLLSIIYSTQNKENEVMIKDLTEELNFVRFLIKKFEVIDSDKNKQISVDELTILYQNYSWPQDNLKYESLGEYINHVFHKFVSNNEMIFHEFCKQYYVEVIDSSKFSMIKNIENDIKDQNDNLEKIFLNINGGNECNMDQVHKSLLELFPTLEFKQLNDIADHLNISEDIDFEQFKKIIQNQNSQQKD